MFSPHDISCSFMFSLGCSKPYSSQHYVSCLCSPSTTHRARLFSDKFIPSRFSCGVIHRALCLHANCCSPCFHPPCGVTFALLCASEKERSSNKYKWVPTYRVSHKPQNRRALSPFIPSLNHALTPLSPPSHAFSIDAIFEVSHYITTSPPFLHLATYLQSNHLFSFSLIAGGHDTHTHTHISCCAMIVTGTR